MNRRIITILASTAVSAAVISIIVVSLIPLPDFPHSNPVLSRQRLCSSIRTTVSNWPTWVVRRSRSCAANQSRDGSTKSNGTIRA